MTSRPFIVGTLVEDHFPVFEADGYTKKTGETVFTPTVWKDGAPSAVSVTITEIGVSGEYKVSFTPISVGVWSCDVLIDYNKQIWYGEYYSAVEENVAIKFTMADDGSIAILGIYLEENGRKRTDITSVTASIKDTAGTLIKNLGTNNAPTSDGVFKFSLASNLLAGHTPYNVIVSATDGTQTWDANLGFAKA